MHRALLGPAPFLLVPWVTAGCVWISDDEVEARRDADGDGHIAASMGGDDCDDADTSVHPGATETCDAVDRDCDG